MARAPRLKAALAAGLLALCGAAPAAAAGPGVRRAVIAFVGGAPGGVDGLGGLAADRRVEALGLIDLTVGGYNEQQALLNLTQGYWVNRLAYQPPDPPAIGLGRDGRIRGWPAIRDRARRASPRIEPGLLGSGVAGGGAYAGVGPAAGPEAVLAADRGGRVAAVSVGPAATVAARARALVARFPLVVVAVPDRRRLDELLAGRVPGELVLVLERPPATTPTGQQPSRLFAVGAIGLPGTGGTLASQTTRRPGLVSAIDVAPTVLDWLGRPVPAGVLGRAVTRGGGRGAAGLERLRARLGVIAGRRWPTIDAFLLGWLGLIAVASAAAGRAGMRAGLRLGGLTALWTPCTVLAAAALAPGRWIEVAVILGGGLVLAAVCDRLVAWPRAPVVPAAAMVLAYAIDLSLGSPLSSTSILGPNPIAGSRFYGVGNELEAALTVVLLAGLGAALPRRPAGRREVAAFAAAGLAFTALVAWGRLGADVGAVFTIGGGVAVGALALRGRPTRRGLALALAVPVAGLVVLGGLDLATGAGSHFTGSVLHAGSAGDLLDTIRRKLAEAFRQLRRGVMPINTAVCLAAGAYGLRRPERVLGRVGGAPGWRGCLAGTFAGGVLGSLTNDSGPVLLVIATFGLGCVVAYLHGGPRDAPNGEPARDGSYPALQPA